MLPHDAMVFAENKCLCVGYQDVDQLKGIVVRLALLGIDHDRNMLMADLLSDIEGCQPIGLDGLGTGHPLLKHGLDVFTIDAFQNFHSRESDRLIFCRRHDEDGDFAGATTSLVTTLLDSSTEEGVVDLDQACELVPSVSRLHCLANLVQHSSGTLKADVDLAGQGQGRQATLVSCDQVDGPEPFHERRPGAMHDRSRSERSLEFAINTLIQHALLKKVSVVATASWTTKTIGPTKFEQALPTGLFGPEPALKGDQIHA